jgi:hypothetical protein
MRIGDLRDKGYHQIYLLACINYRTHNRLPDDANVDSCNTNSFLWSETPEGGTFWSEINRERFDRVERERPSLFEELAIIEDTRDYTIKTNGLFN